MKPTKTPFTTVTGVSGHQFAARYLPTGARYGLNRTLVADKPMVEFYDTTQADDAGGTSSGGFGPLGQFITRYHASTLLERGEDRCAGLALDFDVPSWTIDSREMHSVVCWLRDITGGA